MQNKEDEAYYFIVDTDKADMDALRTVIRSVIEPKDYLKYFVSPLPSGTLLNDIRTYDTDEPLKVEGDICYIRPISQSENIAEMTSSISGEDRLRCRISRSLATLREIKANQHVQIIGTLKINPQTARYELIAEEATVLDQDTELTSWIKQQKQSIGEIPQKRTVQSLRDQMLTIQNIAVLTNDKQASEEFISILPGIKTKLLFTKLSADALCCRIDELVAAKKVDAICIIKGYVNDNYFMADLNNAKLCNKIITTNYCPIFTGLGSIKDHPLISLCSDYDAPTAQQLAMSLICWRAECIAKQEEEKNQQMELLPEKKTSFLHTLRKLLPW